METKDVSEHLQSVAQEIRAVLKKHDVVGSVMLADGLGHGEFLFNYHEPTWSQLRFLPQDDGSVVVHTALHMKSKPAQTERTVNALVVSHDMMARCFMMLDEIRKQWEKHVKIETTGPGLILP